MQKCRKYAISTLTFKKFYNLGLYWKDYSDHLHTRPPSSLSALRRWHLPRLHSGLSVMVVIAVGALNLQGIDLDFAKNV